MKAEEVLTERVKMALGELVFDKIQLMVQAEILIAQLQEATKRPEPEDVVDPE